MVQSVLCRRSARFVGSFTQRKGQVVEGKNQHRIIKHYSKPKRKLVNMTQHKYVVVDEPEFLGIGYAYSISSEEHGEGENKYWNVYFQFHAFMGFDRDIRVNFGKVYLEGKVEGLSQQIKVEIHTEEKLLEIVDLFEPIAKAALEVAKPLLLKITLLEMSKSLS